MYRVLLIVAFCTAWASQALPEDWPAWRGPSADGRVLDSSVTLRWSPETAVWKTPVPGTGYSSPIVRGDRVFLTSSGVEKPTDRCLLCLDFQSGSLLWTTPVFESPIEQMHRLNSPASSTPACDDKRVYVTFSENGYVGVAAIDFEGNLVWKKRPGTFESRHGFHSCPVVQGENVLVSGTQDGEDAFVAALNCETGETIWKTERPNKVRSFAAPFVLEFDGKTQVIVSGAGQTISYDAMTGAEIWRVAGPAGKTVSSMLTDGKLLFVPGGREDLLFAIDPSGSGDVTDSHIVWKGRKGVPYVPSPVLADGRLHLVSDEGIYTCYDCSSGEVIKQSRAAGPTSSSLLYVRDHILLTEDSGTTHVLTSDGTAREIGSNQSGELTYASLGVSKGFLLIRTVDHLLCFAPEIRESRRKVLPPQ